MSSDPSISARHLEKAYDVPSAEPHPITLTEVLLDRARHPLRRTRRDRFLALDDVNFDVSPGEAVGIIGRNGAGKSTLLKILSRITEPTAGGVRLRGRVGSLLEVGTGFHPELTGRENIFLNGAILGMRRREIARQFDAIVEFSGVERFLDLPVKRYSSGMTVRLAFAVAAHLEPEILVVDEVLAVGDADFQKRCLGKMGDVARADARTVLFVSHNMAAIEALCSRCMQIEKGHIVFDGPTHDAISHYLATGPGSAQSEHGTFVVQADDDERTPFPIRSLQILDGEGRGTDSIRMGRRFEVVVDVEGVDLRGEAQFGMEIRNELSDLVCSIGTHQKPPEWPDPHAPEEQLVFDIQRLGLVPGTYTIDVGVWDPDARVARMVEGAARFSIVASDVYGSGFARWRGTGYADFDWTITTADRGSDTRGRSTGLDRRDAVATRRGTR